MKVGNWQKEPLALTAICGVLPAFTRFGSKSLTTLSGQHLGRFERLLRLADRTDSGRFGDGGDEPVALVVSAQELLLFGAVAHQQEQMPVGGLNVKDRDLGVDPRLAGDLEVLAIGVFTDVERDDPRRGLETASRTVDDLQSAPIRANFVSKLLVSIVCLRGSEDTGTETKVRGMCFALRRGCHSGLGERAICRRSLRGRMPAMGILTRTQGDYIIGHGHPDPKHIIRRSKIQSGTPLP